MTCVVYFYVYLLSFQWISRGPLVSFSTPTRHQGSEVGVTEALFVDFSAKKSVILQKGPVRLFESYSYLRVSPGKYECDLQKINCVLRLED